MEIDTENALEAPMVVVLGPLAPAAEFLEDQILPAQEVVSSDASDLVAILRSSCARSVVFLRPTDRLAPDALLYAARVMEDSAIGALIARAERLDPQGMPGEMSPAFDQPSDFLLGWAGGPGIATGQVFLQRHLVLAALHWPGVQQPEQIIAWVLARFTSQLVDKALVRCGEDTAPAELPEVVLRGSLLEDLCFCLGGGRWAQPQARAQVRQKLADSLTRANLHLPIAAALQHQAESLLGTSGRKTPNEPVRSYAEIPVDFERVLPTTAATFWDATPVAQLAPDEMALARNARASLRQDILDLSVQVDEQRRLLLGLQSGALPIAASTSRSEELTLDVSDGARLASAERPCVALEVPSLGSGGLESVVATLARHLPAAGFRVLVICDEQGGALAEELASEGIDVFVLGDQDPTGELAVLLSDQKVDVLSAHYSWLGVRVAAAQDIPTVMTVHNEYGWMGSSSHEPIRALDPLIHGYIAVSGTVAAFHAKRFSIGPGRIGVVRNAANLQRPTNPTKQRSEIRNQLGLASDSLVLLLVGRIEPVKGQVLLAEAVARCAEEGLDLDVLVAGGIADPIYAAKLEQRLDELSLRSRFRMLGPRSDIPDLLVAADLFVQPSLFEGLSLAAVEALQAGVPAILSPTGDAEFLLGEDPQRRAGIIFDRLSNHPQGSSTETRFREAAAPAGEDVDGLARTIREAFGKLDALREIAANRTEQLSELFSTERMVREHAGFLEQAIARGSLVNLAAFQTRLAEQLVHLRSEVEEVRRRREAERGFWEKAGDWIRQFWPGANGRESS